MLRRALVLTLGLVAGFFFFSSPAQAAEFDPWRMTFPVEGEYTHYDNFGACRGSSCSRSHEGNDIMAEKRTPVVAVADGVVTWISSPSNTSSVYLGINHGGGWFTRYIHLDNDTLGTDDGVFYGIAEGIVEGSEVVAGQLIGWVGDSGNAEGTGPHLHFELRTGAENWGHGTAINPWAYLKEAELRTSYNGRFYDDEGSVHEADIDRFYEEDITRGCNPPYNDKYCPKDSVSRGAMAAFIRRLLDLPATGADYFADDNGNTFEGDINALMEAGIGFGCTESTYCPDDPLLREEFAELFTRVFSYTNPGGEDWFTDDDGSRFESSINALRAAGVTKGCNPPDNTRFCPYLPVDRAAMASFFVRALPDL